ncbi:MAG: orotidine-5'-phosphate decarboxylase [Lewinellaceae bacterium]|nr:orotidine-5'-phosphate decarboxylase [Saprospiraceae bacterium]MCB9340533.1 orotidine-5'-phosphate decarboxylase [Lewinellaceae bacterium]
MTRQALVEQIAKKKSFLCIGLDTDPALLPAHLKSLDNPVLEFNRQIIEATKDLCVAYKPNTAFYEAQGAKGWETLEETAKLLPSEHFKIADAKRADIGNTASQYARAFFEKMNFDAVTVAPYMGSDSVKPFLEFPGKWAIVLAMTSNPGSEDFQFTTTDFGSPLFQKVMEKAQRWGTPENMMFVTGATHPTRFAELRRIAPEHFFLVPGVGAQGGDLYQVCQHGLGYQLGLLVNSSRGILYAGSGEDFAEKAREAALEIQQHMAHIIGQILR